MRDAGILDGDLLAVRRTPVAHGGEVVVARLEDVCQPGGFRTPIPLPQPHGSRPPPPVLQPFPLRAIAM